MEIKKIIRLTLSLFIFIGFSTPSFPQAVLDSLLSGKNHLSEIMTVVDQYYQDHPENENEFESDYLHWKRWEWYMSGRLGHSGVFVNIPQLLIDGLKEKEKMMGPGERNINSSWGFVGPSTVPLQNQSATGNGIGRVDRIVFHPTNANIIFLCTPAGGLWNTLNGGTTWNNLTDYLPSPGISGFVISWANTSDMYLLTGDGDSNLGPNGFVEAFGYMRPSIGVFKSTDGGVSWHQTAAFPEVTEPYVGYSLIQSPDNPEILLAATSNGIYRTTNGGDTWVRELSLKTYDIAFKPGDGTRVYATVKGDFWISTNSGDSWTSNSTYDVNPNACGGDDGGRIQIAVTPHLPTVVYLVSGPVVGLGNFCGVWISIDNGTSFTQQSSTPNILGSTDTGNDSTDFSSYCLAIAARPALGTSVVVGGCTVWRSTNSGISWTHATSYFENMNYPYIHPDVHDLAYNPLNEWLYAATDGGVYRSQDYGVTWTNLSPNIETSQFYHMAGWDGNPYKLMGGLQDNGLKYRTGNSSAFYHLDGGDGFDVVFNPDTGEPAYATVNDFYTIFSNNGENSNSYYLQQYYYYSTLAIHNSNPDTVLLGAYDVFKSTNGGLNFYSKGGSGSWSLASCPSNSSRFYSAGGSNFKNGSGALYFSSDIGETWTSKSSNPGFPSSDNWIKITDVVSRPNQSSTVWACFGGFDAGVKVVMSTNTGDSWTNMSANLPNVPINCLAVDNDNGVYAGTDIGVFYRGPSMNTWMPWSNNLPNVPVTEMVIFDDGSTKKIRAATFGRGVWESNMASTCDPAVVVTGGLKGIQHYEASSSLTSTSLVQGGAGTFVSFQSGDYILLSEGFNVVDDSEFLGFISPCGMGGIPALHDNTALSRSNPGASVIPLRRMWDERDGLPFGSIDDVGVQANITKIKFQVKEAGKVQLYIAKQIQDKLFTLYNDDQSGGIQQIEFDSSQLEKTFYYVLLFYEGKLAHFQELDLRPNGI